MHQHNDEKSIISSSLATMCSASQERLRQWLASVSPPTSNPSPAKSHSHFAQQENDNSYDYTERPRKRRKAARASTSPMDYSQEDSQSVVSTVSERSTIPSLGGRPKLVPTPTSTKTRSRSSSPVRKQAAILERVTPAVKMRQRGELTIFQRAADVHTLLQRDLDSGLIPRCLDAYLREANPAKYDDIPSYAFDHTSSKLTPEILSLWKAVDHIYTEANKCDTGRKAENAWLLVAWHLLKLGMEQARVSTLELNNVQTQSINEACLPRCEGIPATRKKADLAFAFTPDAPQVQQLYRAYQSRFPQGDLGHLTDAYTGTLLVTHALEAKKADGSLEEGRLQLAVFHLATLQRIKDLLQSGHPSTAPDLSGIPPMVGWVAVGRMWKCYLSSFTTDGDIAHESTLVDHVLGTESHLAIFRTVKVVTRACKLLHETDWRVLERIVQDCVQTGNPEL